MLIWFFIKKEMKRKEAAKNKEASDEKGYPNNGTRDSRSSSFGNILNNPVTRGNSGRSPRGPISKPILNEDQAAMMRSDFGRKVSPHESDFPEGPDDYEGYYGRGLASEKDEEAGEGVFSDVHGRRPNSSGSTSTCSLDADLEHDIHEVLRSPPKITTPRAVDSMYAAYDYLNDPGRESHYPDPSSPSHNNLRDTNYQAPLKMPNARHFGGNEARVSVAGVAEGRPLSDYGGQRVTKDPNAAYIDVFADSNALLAPPAALGGRGQAGDRLTDFGDFMEESNQGYGEGSSSGNAKK